MESIAPPFIGGGTGAGFGGVLRASFGVSFADMLRDRQVQVTARLGTDVDDLALQVSYMKRIGRWNWGLAGGIVPSRFVGARRAIARVEELITRETEHLRYTHQWGKLAARYNISRTQRVELGVGVRRTGFEWQTITRVIDSSEQKTVSRTMDEAPAGHPILVSEAAAAYVHDTAVSGPTSPLLGQRLRLELEPAVGGLLFTDATVDVRRYFMPIRPVTFAVRAEHVGRYGPDAGDRRLTRSFSAFSHASVATICARSPPTECGRTATSCSPLDELAGGRFALVNLEVRAPVLGLLSGDLYYGRVPIEAIAFADAGFLWTRRTGAAGEQDRFRSAGAGGRVNIGGFVFEVTAARVFDRPDKNWGVSVLLRPGW